MRSTSLILVVYFVAVTNTFANNSAGLQLPYNYSTLEDGWYSAKVQYSNYSTGTNATYTLNVKVEYDKISNIDFGNGGSVHSGFNNEGYIYSGGYLTFEKDFSGNITAATATVTVSDNNGMRYYKIRIE